MVHDHGRAEDLTQEVFVNALRRMRATDRPIVFKPWVYEIAKNACIDQFRRTSRAEEVSIDAQDGSGLGPSDHGKLHARGATPDAAVEAKQQLADLQGAFGGLSDAHHQILVMRELEGLSYREIGERLGMSRPSVESTLFRARRRLTEEYEELRTGERCLRIQSIIEGASAAGALGIRDQRRVGSHISHCQPCRKHAVMAGLDAGAIARRPVRARIAAFLPLPGFLKRFVGGADGGADVVSGHTWAVAAAQHGDAMAGWMKAGAVAAAVALAGGGTVAVTGGVPGAGGAARPADAVGAPASGASGSGGAGAAPTAAEHGSGGTNAGAGGAAGAGGGGSSSSSSRVAKARGTGSRSSSAGVGSTSGPAGAADGSGSGARGKGFSGDTSGGGGSSKGDGGGSKESASSSSSPSKGPSSGAGGGSGGTTTSSTTTTTSDPVQSTVNQTTTTVAGGGASEPLVDPNLGALTGGGGASQPPASAGGAVSGATGAVGGAVGGQVGGVVEGTGEAVGNTVDQALGAVGSILGGGKKQ
jgi:RNA polymerase sigma factor (sigma-70 family)